MGNLSNNVCPNICRNNDHEYVNMLKMSVFKDETWRLFTIESSLRPFRGEVQKNRCLVAFLFYSCQVIQYLKHWNFCKAWNLGSHIRQFFFHSWSRMRIEGQWLLKSSHRLFTSFTSFFQLHNAKSLIANTVFIPGIGIDVALTYFLP